MLSSVLVLSLLSSQVLAQLPGIIAKGSKFFTEDGDQFFIKGVAYQLDEEDTLRDPQQCARDAALMRTLGTNSIRVYHVQPEDDHDACMASFADAGIYVWLDLDDRDSYILPDGSNTPSWTQEMMAKYEATMDAFANYDNLAGVFIGNEMLTEGKDSVAAPYVKAAARDMKAYRDKQGYRQFPVGYSAADIPDLRPNLQNYLACGDDPADAVDFYSLNAYEWCGQSTYEGSGYAELEQNATGYSIPIYFSETGCNIDPRTFDDQTAIFGPEMVDTWSGAIIYQWVQVENDYGLISYGGNRRAGNPSPVQPDFNNLKAKWAAANPVGVQEGSYQPEFDPPPCPAYDSKTWLVKPDAPLPTLGEDFKSYVKAQGIPTSALAQPSSARASGGGNGGSGGSDDSGSSDGGDDSSSSTNGVSARGLATIETAFRDWSVHNHLLFWIAGVVVAVAGPALVFVVY